ncbi:lipase [Salinisphaera sp. T31B1]|uniref:esterase/lipase family protein n=1 Tax=Salinisphaera sp. T31B1 TaxID=727963 RepID=UPI003341C4DE
MRRSILSVLTAVLAIGLIPTPSRTAAAETVPAFPDEPPLHIRGAALDESLSCTPFVHEDRPPVLLVHGTTVTGTEEFSIFYAPQLARRGFDVCVVTYPDRGLGDQQISAEYIVHALRTIHAQTGRRVAMIGHSQGASMPRWALKYWPSARDAVADFVLLAGPNHGTSAPVTAVLPVTQGLGLFTSALGLFDGLTPAGLLQFERDANFTTAVNAGDETPGDIDYTSLYTRYDELVQPVSPVPTAALDFGQDNPRVANILLQDVCPGHLAEHFSIGTTDALAFALALDAISHPGPADVARAGGPSGLCGRLPIALGEYLNADTVTGLIDILTSTLSDPMLDLHLTADEPRLMDYARTDGPSRTSADAGRSDQAM